jgi:hypothetical protein
MLELRRHTISVVFLLLALGVLMSAHRVHSEEAGSTVGQYFQLRTLLLESQITSWQEKIRLLEEFGDDPSDFLELEQEATYREWALIDSLHNAAGISYRDYVKYEVTHRQDIRVYLGENPAINEQIENLKTQNDTAIDHYETLLAQRGIRGETVSDHTGDLGP